MKIEKYGKFVYKDGARVAVIRPVSPDQVEMDKQLETADQEMLEKVWAKAHEPGQEFRVMGLLVHGNPPYAIADESGRIFLDRKLEMGDVFTDERNLEKMAKVEAGSVN